MDTSKASTVSSGTKCRIRVSYSSILDISMKTKGFYARISSDYYRETFGQRLTVSSLTRALRTQAVLHLLDLEVNEPSLVGDIGCGPAQFAAPLLDKGHRYIGIDIEGAMFQHTAVNSLPQRDAAFMSGRIEALPLTRNSVEVILCIGVIEYVIEPSLCFQEIYRVLKPGGLAIVSFPNLLNPIHIVRTAVRPFLSPILGLILPRLKNTVFASGIPYRAFTARQICRQAQCSHLSPVTVYFHNYGPWLFNHPIPTWAMPASLRMETLGRRIVPSLGSNVIVCLRKDAS